MRYTVLGHHAAYINCSNTLLLQNFIQIRIKEGIGMGFCYSRRTGKHRQY